ASVESIAQEPRARGSVWSTTGMTDDAEAIETEVVSQLGDIACPRLVGAIRVIGAVSVPGPIGGDQSHPLLRGDLAQRCEETARSRRSMKRDHRSSRCRSILNPRQIATIPELEHAGVAHGRILCRDPAPVNA